MKRENKLSLKKIEMQYPGQDCKRPKRNKNSLDCIYDQSITNKTDLMEV